MKRSVKLLHLKDVFSCNHLLYIMLEDSLNLCPTLKYLLAVKCTICGNVVSIQQELKGTVKISRTLGTPDLK